jgi:hypothetical protein
MNTEQLKHLWDIYKVFCVECIKNPTLDPASMLSFLGWLEYRDEIGNSRYIQGVSDGYVQSKKETYK